MRRIFLLLLALASTSWAEQTVITKLPTDVTLTSGAIIRRISVVRWEKDYVVLKHQGGTDPIHFSHMAPESRTAFEAYKQQSEKPRKYTGSAFIVTQGDGNYKLGNLLIVIVPGTKNILRMPLRGFDENHLPEGSVFTRSDADGKFSFVWSNGSEFTLCAFGTRSTGLSREYYKWMIQRQDLKDPENIQLSNHNLE